MLVKAEGSTIIKFPYNLHELFEENPNTTFPRPMPDEVLESYGIFRVVAEQVEADPSTSKLEFADTPTLVDGVWTLAATVVNLSSEELQSREDGHAASMRATRDELLAETDWWAVADRTMSAEETAYRQALRDITTHANWPYLEDADWPVKPV